MNNFKQGNLSKFKFISFLFIFYAIYGVFVPFEACRFLSNPFSFSSVVFSTALISFFLVLTDIIAEVYGIKVSAICYFLMILIRMIVAIIFCILCNHAVVTRYLLFAAFYHPLIYTLSWYLNVFLLTRWKVIMGGKYFWLRSIGASGILILFYCLFSTIEDAQFSNWPRNIFINYIILAFLLRILFLVIFAFPANLIVSILKVIENKHQPIFYPNPFKV